MKKACFVLLAAICCELHLVAIAAADPQIVITPKMPRPGEVIFVTMHPDKEIVRASCSWGGSNRPFISDGDDYTLVLPVSISATVGGHHATVYWKCADGCMGKLSLPVEIKSRKFGIQHLRLSSTQESKYSALETQRERELIGAALGQVTPDRLWQGNFAMPVKGRISTSFGLQRYVNGAFSYRHRGIDIAAPAGTPVRAASTGMVSLAEGDFLLHGKTIVIDHGHGISTLYLHLSEIEVETGQMVQQGDIIGRVGSTGVATGPHLHYAVYSYHQAVDPLFWNHLPAIASP